MSYLREIEELKDKYEKENSEFYELNQDAYGKFINLVLMCDNWPDKEAKISYKFDPENYDGEFCIESDDISLENEFEKDTVFLLSGLGGADYMSFSATKDGRLRTKIGVKCVWLKII